MTFHLASEYGRGSWITRLAASAITLGAAATCTSAQETCLAKLRVSRGPLTGRPCLVDGDFSQPYPLKAQLAMASRLSQHEKDL